MTKDNEGWTALGSAVIGGKIEIVRLLQMLLDDGANVNEKDWIGSTALDWAAPGGHEMTVEVLLRYGCDLKSRDKYENTALHWAIQHEAIVRLLLANSADVNARNDCGQTALFWVARDGPLSAAHILQRIIMDEEQYIGLPERVTETWCGCWQRVKLTSMRWIAGEG